MKRRFLFVPAVLAALCLAGCSGYGNTKSVSYKDGTYTAQSSVFTNDDGSDEGNGYGEVTITIAGGKITACTYATYEPDGTLKDENYGKKDGEVANRDYFNKAQKAVAACPKYADALVEKGRLEDVDAISGATVNYNQFKESVTDALLQAKAD